LWRAEACGTDQTESRTKCFIDTSQLILAIQPPGKPQTPTLYHSASECALKVWMVGGVATIAERNQVRRFIDSTGGPRD